MHRPHPSLPHHSPSPLDRLPFPLRAPNLTLTATPFLRSTLGAQQSKVPPTPILVVSTSVLRDSSTPQEELPTHPAKLALPENTLLPQGKWHVSTVKLEHTPDLPLTPALIVRQEGIRPIHSGPTRTPLAQVALSEPTAKLKVQVRQGQHEFARADKKCLTNALIITSHHHASLAAVNVDMYDLQGREVHFLLRLLLLCHLPCRHLQPRPRYRPRESRAT